MSTGITHIGFQHVAPLLLGLPWLQGMAQPIIWLDTICKGLGHGGHRVCNLETGHKSSTGFLGKHTVGLRNHPRLLHQQSGELLGLCGSKASAV